MPLQALRRRRPAHPALLLRERWSATGASGCLVCGSDSPQRAAGAGGSLCDSRERSMPAGCWCVATAVIIAKGGNNFLASPTSDEPSEEAINKKYSNWILSRIHTINNYVTGSTKTNRHTAMTQHEVASFTNQWKPYPPSQSEWWCVFSASPFQVKRTMSLRDHSCCRHWKPLKTTFAPLCVCMYVYVNVLRSFRLILVTESDPLE